MKNAALRYARLGWPVFPCRPGGKTPLTSNGLHAATTNATQVAGWWDKTPDANIAIRTGAGAGLVVIDVDGDDGRESLWHLEQVHGPLPATASVVTPRGGQHYYFRHPGGSVANSVSRIADHIDVRGDGGYVLGVPSRGSNGRQYEPDDQVRVALMPEWLKRLVVTLSVPEKTPRTPVSTWTDLVTKGAPVGARNDGLTRLTGHLLARDVNAALVVELVRLVNRQSSPPLPDDEVLRIVESIAGRELAKRTGARR